jgi:hypothetical protein
MDNPANTAGTNEKTAAKDRDTRLKKQPKPRTNAQWSLS